MIAAIIFVKGPEGNTIGNYSDPYSRGSGIQGLKE